MADSPGIRLQKARIAQGLSVEEVSGATRMRPSQVVDLEKDDYTGFASVAYARNFLQTYARFLKVDVQDVLQNLVLPTRIGVENYQYLRNQGDEDTAYRPASNRPRPTVRDHAAPSGKWLLIALIAIPAMIATVMLIVNLNRLGLGATPPAATTDAAAPATPIPVSTPTPTATPAPPISPTPTPPSLWEDTPAPTPVTTVIAPGVTISSPQKTP